MMRARTLLLVATLTAAGCSSGSGSSATSPKPTPPAPLQILVTNDDGFDAPGIDVVAQALRALPNVKVTIVAPATNKSGTGSQSTPGTLTATPRTTASGIAATAVDGFPADTVRYALETLHLRPDVVVSGINAGQNLGPITPVSGTIGAAKAAATAGIAAIASSQGLVEGVDAQYPVGARLVVDWVRAHRSSFHFPTGTTPAAVDIVNLNIPTCAAGKVRGVRTAPLATDGTDATAPADCRSTTTATPTDVAAFHHGFAAVTQMTNGGETVTTSTTWPSTRSS